MPKRSELTFEGGLYSMDGPNVPVVDDSTEIGMLIGCEARTDF